MKNVYTEEASSNLIGALGLLETSSYLYQYAFL